MIWRIGIDHLLEVGVKLHVIHWPYLGNIFRKWVKRIFGDLIFLIIIYNFGYIFYIHCVKYIFFIEKINYNVAKSIRI